MHEMWKREQVYEITMKMHKVKVLVKKSGKWRKRHLGGHDMVRKMDKQGEVLICCRKCSAMRDREWDPNC